MSGYFGGDFIMADWWFCEQSAFISSDKVYLIFLCKMNESVLTVLSLMNVTARERLEQFALSLLIG